MRERFEAGLGSGRNSHEVERQSEQLIGQGSFAKIYSVTALVGNGEQRRPVRLVEKRYSESPHPVIAINAEKNAERAVENYRRLKAAGLKVFNTFRLSPDHKTILMTNAQSADWECTSTNEPLELVAQPAKLDVIPNWDEVQTNIFDDVQRATEAGLRLDRDAVFFLINRKNDNQLDYVFGDCDAAGALEREHRKNVGASDEVGPMFAKHNFMAGLFAISNFLEHNLRDPQPYLIQLKEVYSERLNRATSAGNL